MRWQTHNYRDSTNSKGLRMVIVVSMATIEHNDGVFTTTPLLS